MLADVPFSCYFGENQTTNGASMRVLGVDPGLRNMGWGIIDAQGARISHVANGICTSRTGDLAGRLLSLHEQLSEIVARYAPDTAAVEQTFVNKDGAGTLKLGQARGVALLVPSLAGLAVAEYAPNLVKKTVVGTGHAEKDQIRAMVKVLMPRATFNTDDAADALAIAICHAQHRASGAARLAAHVAAKGAA